MIPDDIRKPPSWRLSLKAWWRSLRHDWRCAWCDHPMHTDRKGEWACPIHDYVNPFEYLIRKEYRAHPEYRRLKKIANERKGD